MIVAVIRFLLQYHLLIIVSLCLALILCMMHKEIITLFIILLAGYYTKRNENSWVLPSECSILSLPPSASPTFPITNWEQYYSYRGLSLKSPAAALLTYPLTLYYVLTSCIKNDGKQIKLSFVHHLTLKSAFKVIH